MAGFFDYERQTNSFLKKLKETEEFNDIATYAFENEAVVLAPQSVSLEGLELSRDFIESHIVLSNPRDGSQWVSMNGRLLGCFSAARDALYVIPAAARSAPLAYSSSAASFAAAAFNPLADPRSLFALDRNLFEQLLLQPEGARGGGIHVLREGQLALDREGKRAVPLILISEPLPCGAVTARRQQSSPTETVCALPSAADSTPAAIAALSFSPQWSPFEPDSLPKEQQQQRTAGRPTARSIGELLQQFGLDTPHRPQTLPPTPPQPEAPAAVAATAAAHGAVQEQQSKLLQPLFPPDPPNPLPSSPSSSSSRGNSGAPGQQVASRERLSVVDAMRLFFNNLKQPPAADVFAALKSFVHNFLSSPPSPTAAPGIVRHFLDGMEETVTRHPMWRGASDDVIEGAVEGLEKYVMNKLYPCVFEAVSDQCRKDDEALRRRILQLAFICPQHLDIQSQHRDAETVRLACTELHKINDYRTPRDKTICVLNCCKVIYNFLNRDGDGSGADEFLPLLIFVVLTANPPHLESNVHYVQHYRHPAKMSSESGYYFTHLVSAITFIKRMDATCVSMDATEFTRNLEAFGRKAGIPVESTKPSASVPLSLHRIGEALSRAAGATAVLAGRSSPSEQQQHPPLLVTSKSATSQPAMQSKLTASDGGAEQQQHWTSFAERSAGHLRLSEVPSLLSAYKAVVAENVDLRRQLAALQARLNQLE